MSGGLRVSDLFSTVTTHKFEAIWSASGELKHKELMKLVGLNRQMVAAWSGTLIDSVRYDDRMSENVESYLYRIANIVDHIAEVFDNHQTKIKQWFFVSNPSLGGMSPLKMIQSGKEEKLLQIILDLKNGNIA